MLVRLTTALRHLRRRFSRAEWWVRRSGWSTSTEANHAPGLLFIQIDGLARRELERALARGRLPGLRRLQQRQGYRLHDFYPGLPASTPAVQGELHYGQPAAVPAFSFLDPRADGIEMMMSPDAAKRIEADLAAHAPGLLEGGSSWSNIYTGGAAQAESHFCGASLGLGDLWRTGKLRNLVLFAFLHFPSFLRLLALLPVEFVLAVSDALRGTLIQRQPWTREFIFVFARVLVCVGLRELITLGAKVDLARGLPIIHVNFLGYDEQSHRRGPSSAFAHWTLKGIDRAITHLHRTARRAHRRDYEVWIFSDHGQIHSTPFSHRVEGGLETLVRRHLAALGYAADPASAPRSQSGTTAATLLGGPRRQRRQHRARDRARLSVFEQEVFALAAMGPVGHLYLAHDLPPDHLRRLAANLVAAGVPGMLIPGPDHTATWLTARGEFSLPQDCQALPHPEPLRPLVAQDLAALAHHPQGGQLVALGWSPSGDAYTFAEENGSHAGPSPEETGAFLLLPAHVRLPVTQRALRPRELRALARHHLGRQTAPTSPADPPPSGDRPDPIHLRVATLNTHACIGMDGRCSPARVARLIRSLEVDVIALQELDLGRHRTRHEDQLVELATRTGFHAAWCPCVSHHNNAAYGHGLLSRYPILSTHTDRLPHRGSLEPRGVLRTCIQVEDTRVHVLSTHLGLTRWERLSQVRALLGPLGFDQIPADEPVLLLGDLNTAGGSLPYRLLARQLRNVQAHCHGHVGQATFPSFYPIRQLDHIFVSAHFGIRAVDIPRSELTRLASDHLPLVADLQLRSANTTPGSVLDDGRLPVANLCLVP